MVNQQHHGGNAHADIGCNGDHDGAVDTGNMEALGKHVCNVGPGKQADKIHYRIEKRIEFNKGIDDCRTDQAHRAHDYQRRRTEVATTERQIRTPIDVDADKAQKVVHCHCLMSKIRICSTHTSSMRLPTGKCLCENFH